VSKQPQIADLCVVGAGPAGFSVAALAAQLGTRVVLIERETFGGSFGGTIAACALMAAAGAADGVRHADRFGVRAGPVTVDMNAVRMRIRSAVAAAAPNVSEARAVGLGVTVMKGAARFVGPDTVAVGDSRVPARRFVIATGSQPLIPPVPGLESVAYLTERTALDLDPVPGALVVLGGDPFGIGYAQALVRLGIAVTVVAPEGLLPREDPELAAVVRTALRRDGAAIVEGATVARVEGGAGVIAVVIDAQGAMRIEGTHLLVNSGRRPAISGLGLEEARIAASERGIAVDAGLRTGNRRVYAVGGCIGGFGSADAGDQAGVVIRRALFRLPARATRAPPRLVLTAPELAHVGLTESEARRATADLVVLRWPFAENDRARAERTTAGMVKILTTRRGRILGASLVGPRAGELVPVWALAIRKGLRIRDLAEMPVASPTLADVGARVAQTALLPRLLAPITRRLVRLLGKLDVTLPR
jgi:pyruvate/2-oxoglutarate dehydrogenase complex dihydrolipoamide dehydrogenase (E3) component